MGRLPHAAVQRRGERSFKKTVIAKPSINYRKQAVIPVPMATGSPMDFVLFFFFLSCSHLLRYMHLLPTRDLSVSSADEFLPSSQWLERSRQAKPGREGGGESKSLCNFGLKVPGGWYWGLRAFRLGGGQVGSKEGRGERPLQAAGREHGSLGASRPAPAPLTKVFAIQAGTGVASSKPAGSSISVPATAQRSLTLTHGELWGRAGERTGLWFPGSSPGQAATLPPPGPRPCIPSPSSQPHSSPRPPGPAEMRV